MKKISLVLLIFLLIPVLSGCRAEVEIRKEWERPDQRDRYEGVVINESDYSLRVKVTDVTGRDQSRIFTLSPNERAYLRLYEREYRFEARYKYFDDFFQGVNLRINARRDDAYWRGSYYDWYVVFRSRRPRTHP